MDLIGTEAAGIEPRAGFDGRNLESRAGQRQHGDAASRAQTDHRHVDGLQLNGHAALHVLMGGPPMRAAA